MRFWWNERKRQRTASRPRVAQAVQRAREAQLGAGAGVGLGSATADVGMGMVRHFEALERVTAFGPLRAMRRREEAGLAPGLLLETARAARNSGRRPEEVWAEALREWLMAQALVPDEPPARPAFVLTRRQQTWRDIESTLQSLRAS